MTHTFPGLVDMHVHLREPGFEYKEDIHSGTLAAAAGGITACCAMPNTSPVADCPDVIKLINAKAQTAAIRVYPIGAVTIGQKGLKLTDFAALKAAGCVALSDDGMPITDDSTMREALRRAKQNDMLIISHCEPEAEMAQRHIKLAQQEDARIHIAHVSLAGTVDIIRKAKSDGIKVTAETCPHYCSLTNEFVGTHGADACMNPPLATQKDVEAVIEGLKDGTIDVIATDHAPHSPQEKANPPGEAPNGIIGLETSLAVTLTYLYHPGYLTLDEIMRKMCYNPMQILNLPQIPADTDSVTFDPDEEWVVNPGDFKSKSRNTPYAGMTLRGRVISTKCRGKTVYTANHPAP